MVNKRRKKHPESRRQHHRAAVEPPGHPQSTVGVLHLQIKVSRAPKIVRQAAVGTQGGAMMAGKGAVHGAVGAVGTAMIATDTAMMAIATAMFTTAVAMIAMPAATTTAVGAVKPVVGAENMRQEALSTMTTITGATNDVDGAVNAMNGAVKEAVIAMNGAVKGAVIAMNGAISTVHQAMNIMGKAMTIGNRALSTMKGIIRAMRRAMMAENGVVAVIETMWCLHPHIMNTADAATGVTHQVTAAVHLVSGITGTWSLIHLLVTVLAATNLQSMVPHRSPTVVNLQASVQPQRTMDHPLQIHGNPSLAQGPAETQLNLQSC